MLYVYAVFGPLLFMCFPVAMQSLLYKDVESVLAYKIRNLNEPSALALGKALKRQVFLRGVLTILGMLGFSLGLVAIHILTIGTLTRIHGYSTSNMTVAKVGLIVPCSSFVGMLAMLILSLRSSRYTKNLIQACKIASPESTASLHERLSQIGFLVKLYFGGVLLMGSLLLYMAFRIAMTFLR